ncbi:hypothetical protein ACFQH2_02445 [Natronoarchaeum sp. GCM10025703]|uniref:DUF7856 family protein n=1 Tax=unclassified Natronoarchaeum TaxID=2620183 RepID=UPI0036196A00
MDTDADLGRGRPGRTVATAPLPGQPTRIRVRVADSVLDGVAVDLRLWPITADEAAAAIRGCGEECTIDCPTPGPLFDALGVVDASLSLPLQRVLATVARRQGHREATGELASVRKELATLTPASCNLAEKRRQVADAGADESALAERVATLRGELLARKEANEDVSETEAALADAVAELTTVRTERLAAEQALERAQADARTIRDQRERRLRLQDRERNLTRALCRDLADNVYEAFADAVRTVPGTATPGNSATDYDGDDVTAALAVLRMLRTATPAVLAVDRFRSPEHAADVLGVPVVRI